MVYRMKFKIEKGKNTTPAWATYIISYLAYAGPSWNKFPMQNKIVDPVYEKATPARYS